MDTWSMAQMRQMALGGNKKLRQFFDNYDLNTEELKTKYKSKAARNYRLELKSENENIPLASLPPSYDEGRETISISEL